MCLSQLAQVKVKVDYLVLVCRLVGRLVGSPGGRQFYRYEHEYEDEE